MKSMKPVVGQPFVGSMARMKWQEFPGHFGGALSKELVAKSMMGTSLLDVRISHYQPMAYVENHTHAIQEQVYYVLEGEGMMVIDGEEHLLGKHDYVWIPAGAKHGITACGIVPLVFLVVSGPATDEQGPA
jgi:mannose-6-phosphate isomerase-like protein (cupin superfamily)